MDKNCRLSKCSVVWVRNGSKVISAAVIEGMQVYIVMEIQEGGFMQCESNKNLIQ